MGSTKETFVVYASQLSAMLELPDTELRGILAAMLEYNRDGTEPAFTGALSAFWKTVKDGIDRDTEKWKSIREKRIEAGRKGGKQTQANQANASLAKQTQANQAVSVPVSVPVSVIKEKSIKETPDKPPFLLIAPNEEIKTEKLKKSNFRKPTVEEVKEYCEEKKSPIDPEAFWNFYESKGWMLGKNHMKDWKAAVRTWEQRSQPTESRTNPNRPALPSLEELRKREGEL